MRIRKIAARFALYCLLLFASLSPVPATAAAVSKPTQVRLSWGNDPRTSLRILWQTVRATSSHTVEYGLGPQLGLRALGKRILVPRATGVLHGASLTGLQPGTTYYYRVGDPKAGYSRVSRFRTAPAAPEDFVFTAFGDQGTNAASRKNVYNALKEKPAFHLLLGDLSYANGRAQVWDKYFRLIEPLTSAVPFMPTLGNHENESNPEAGAHRGIGYTSYLSRLALPGVETHYTFDYAGARFVSYNTDQYKNKTQLAWLEATLAAARRDRTVRWLIVFHHVPLYSSVVRRPDNTWLIQCLQPLYDKYHVDLVLNGHNHVYERFYPLREGRPVSKERTDYAQGEGTIYITCGGGGDSLYRFVPVQPQRTALRERTFCYLRVFVPGRGPLVVEAKRLDGTGIERFRITPR